MTSSDDAHGQPGSTGPVVSSLDGLSILVGGTSVKTPPPTDTLPPGLADHPDYEVIRELGQGGMGTVYLAKNRLMGRHEVLKVVSRHMMNRPGALDRFLVEIRNAARLHHTNIVTAYSATRIGESIVFAMEYVEGLDLSKLVKAKGPLPVSNVYNSIPQAALGLQHASERGLVHRDIKPGNLMLAKLGNRAVIKLLDFGLAKVKSEGAVDGGLTHEGQMLGTPDYIAPEQISDARRADIRADIYSLGCTFYYLLTGGPPFHATSLYEILQAHHSMDALPLNLARPEVPIELAALVAMMMAKEPERRFQTPRDVAQALLPFFKKGIVGAAGPKAEMPQPGGADHKRASTRVLSVSTQPATQTPTVPPPLERPSATPRTELAWESLIKFKETEPPAEPAQVVTGSARVPRWIWPSVSVGGMVLALFVAWALIGWFKTSNATIELVAKSPEVKDQVDDRSARSGVEKSITWERPPDPPLEAADKQDASGSAVEPLDSAPVVKGGTQTATAPFPTKGPALSPVVRTTSAKVGFQPLFNGKDRTGWKVHPKEKDNWHVVRGVLVGYGPSISHLYTERDDFTDFHLRVEARFNEDGSGGVYFRCPFGPNMPADDPKWPDGFEATINNARIVRNSTGGLYPGRGNNVFIADFARSTSVSFGQWFTLEVIADGNALAVLVNGITSGFHVDRRNERFSSGHIALQQYSPGSKIEFRKIEIKDLNRWNQRDSKEIKRFPDTLGRVNRVAFSPDGLGILSGGSPVEYTKRTGGGNYFGGGHYSFRLRDVASERNVFTVAGEGVSVKALAISSDGRYAASSERSLRRLPILIWDIKSGERIHRLLRTNPIDDVSCAALSFSPEDRRVMAALANGTVLAWELVTEQEQPPIPLKAGPIKHDEFPVASFTSNRLQLVTARRTGALELWDLQTGQRMQRFAGHSGDVRNLVCSADGRLILSAGTDNTVRLWDVASGKERRQLKCDDRQVRCIALSPDSKRALSADVYGLVHLWDLASGKEVCSMEGHTMVVNSVAFSPDGRRAVSGSDDRTVRLWQLPASDVRGGTPSKTAE
jgi:serine/threonine protein kinase/WD40 repeat protein